MSDYELLGLTYAATEEDAHNAYLRLLEEGIKEKDPQRYEEITAACSHFGPEREELSDFSVDLMFPENNLHQESLLKNVMNHIMQGDSQGAFDLAHQYADRYPFDQAFQRAAMYSSYVNHSYVFSEREAAWLYTHYPQDPVYLMILANSCYHNNWWNKALTLYERGYAAGYRGVTFESQFAMTLALLGRSDEGIDISLRMLKRPRTYVKEWCNEYVFSFIDFHTLCQNEWREHGQAPHAADGLTCILSTFRENPEVFENIMVVSALRNLTASLALFLPEDEQAAWFTQILDVFEKAKVPQGYDRNEFLNKLNALSLLTRQSDIPRSVILSLCARPDLPVVPDANPMTSDNDLLEHFFTSLEYALCLIQETSGDRIEMKRIYTTILAVCPHLEDLLWKCMEEMDKAESIESFKKAASYYYFGALHMMHRVYWFAFPDQVPPVLSPENYAGTKRNDPCPCGSGKKYKACCMPNVEAATSIVRPDLPF